MKGARLSIPVLSLCLLMATASCCAVGSNFHVVHDERLYRSAQMDAGELEDAINTYAVRTVVNLRGGSGGKEWHRQEKATCVRLGVTHLDVRLSSRRLPGRDTVLELIRIFETAKYPMMVHCRGGADRTGLASGIYRLVVEKASVAEAKRQLGFLRYCHLAVGPASAMDRFFEMYEETGRGKDIKRWVAEDYAPQPSSGSRAVVTMGSPGT